MVQVVPRVDRLRTVSVPVLPLRSPGRQEPVLVGWRPPEGGVVSITVTAAVTVQTAVEEGRPVQGGGRPLVPPPRTSSTVEAGGEGQVGVAVAHTRPRGPAG